MYSSFISKLFLISSFSTVLFSCGEAKKTDLLKPEQLDSTSTNLRTYSVRYSDSVEIKVTAISADYFDHFSDQPGESVTADSSIKKENGIIQLPLTLGKVYTMADTGVSDGSSDSYIDYQYKGQLASIDQYYVIAMSYESCRFLLIDKHTGKESRVDQDPVVSPGATKLISFFIDEYELNDQLTVGISVQKIEDKKILPENENTLSLSYQTLADYNPYPSEKEVSWENEKTLLLKLTYTGNKTKQYSDYLKLEFQE